MKYYQIIVYDSKLVSFISNLIYEIIYVKNNQEETKEIQKSEKNMYVIKKGDTLWGIAQKFKGLTVWKLKSINNLVT